MKRPPLAVTLSTGERLEFKYLSMNGLLGLPNSEDAGETEVSVFLAGQVLENPVEPSALEALNDEDFTLLLRAYAGKELGTVIPVLSRSETIAAFTSAAREKRKEAQQINATMVGLMTSLAPIIAAQESIRQIQDTITATTAATLAAITPKIALDRFVPMMQVAEAASKLQWWFDEIARAGDGVESIKKLDLAFASRLWSTKELAELGDLAKTDSGHVAKKVIEESKDRDGHEALMEFMAEIPLLTAGRHRIVKQALAAHRRRFYHTAIPALLTQIEGIVTDILVFLGEATIKSGKVKRAGKATQPKGGVKPKKTYSGLHDKTEELDLQSNEPFAELGAHITEILCKKRNGILHGTDTNFGTAEEAARTVFVLVVTTQLAHQIYTSRNKSGST